MQYVRHNVLSVLQKLAFHLCSGPIHSYYEGLSGVVANGSKPPCTSHGQCSEGSSDRLSTKAPAAHINRHVLPPPFLPTTQSLISSPLALGPSRMLYVAASQTWVPSGFQVLLMIMTLVISSGLSSASSLDWMPESLWLVLLFLSVTLYLSQKWWFDCRGWVHLLMLIAKQIASAIVFNTWSCLQRDLPSPRAFRQQLWMSSINQSNKLFVR